MKRPSPALEPMGIAASLAAFGLPALTLYLVVWHAMPYLDARGVSAVALFALMALPLVGCLVAAFVLFQREGHPWTAAALRERMRLGPMGRRGWLWVVVLSLGGLALYLAGGRMVGAIFPEAATPAVFERIFGDETTFLGRPLAGAWWLVGVWFLFYLANVFGEELWFRGMVLPRQVVAFGRWAWLVHGVLWAGWHAGFFPTDALVILPEALAYGWVSQRTRSTWPALVAHAFLNALAGIRLVSGAMG